MSFPSVRMVDPSGRECLVGSAIEREHLIAHGYRVVEPEPEPEPAPEPKRSPVTVKKPDTK